MADELAYLICDGNNDVLCIDGINLWGKVVRMPAIFTKEQDALEVLWAAEEMVGLKENRVKRISAWITTTEKGS